MSIPGEVMTSGFKESAYNYFLKLSPDKVVGYNFLYRTLLLFNAEEYACIEGYREQLGRVDRFTSSDELFQSLQKFKFFLSQGFNELEYFKFCYYQSLFNNTTLVTMLLPTLACNFDCPYCFEYKQNVFMDDETVQAYLRWVEAKLRDKKHFHITWFGGEPLLSFGLMRRITKDVLKMCEAASCGYSASLTSNGYLLTDSVIRQLSDLRINNVQVTFDGPRQTHDCYRKTKDGRPTFDRIVANVERYCELSTSHLPLGIRINVTDDNLPIIPEIFGCFSEQVKRRSRLYFRYVWSSEVANHRVFSSDANRPDAFDKLAGLYHKASQAGIHIDNHIDEISFNYCEVDFANHFTIDPRGYIYLCGHTFKEEEAIGHVSRDLTDEQLSHYCRWININPFNDTECLACQMLPLCKGGCRKSRYYGGRGCIEEKNSIDLYVSNLYDKWYRQNTACPPIAPL
jgi:uncharacterized protein